MKISAICTALSIALASSAYASQPFKVPAATAAPGSHARLQDRTLYEVDLKCQATAPLPSTAWEFDQAIISPLDHWNATASHYLVISTTLPPLDATNPGHITQLAGGAGIYPIFSIQASNVVDYRAACTGSMYITGGQQYYLVPVTSWATQNNPGPALQGIFGVSQLISPIWSIFAPLPAAVANAVTNVQQTQTTVTNILTFLNREENYAQATEIQTGTYIVTTAFSKITITVSDVGSLVKSKAPTILSAYRVQLDGAPEKISAVADCAGMASKLLSTGLSKEEDVPYALAYLGAKSFTSKSDLIHCLGADYALAAAPLPATALWNYIADSMRLTEDDANSVYPPHQNDAPLQPDYGTIVGTLDDFVLQLGRTGLAADPVPDSETQALQNDMTSTVLINDKTLASLFSSATSPLDAKGLARAFASLGYHRFGCAGPMKSSYGDTSAGLVAIFMAFKVPADATTATPDNAVLLEPVFKNGVVSQLYVYASPDAARAVVADHGGQGCEGLAVH